MYRIDNKIPNIRCFIHNNDCLLISNYHEKSILFINISTKNVLWQNKLQLDVIYLFPYLNMFFCSDGNITKALMQADGQDLPIFEDLNINLRLYNAKKTHFFPIYQSLSLFEMLNGIYDVIAYKIEFLKTGCYVNIVLEDCALGQRDKEMTRYDFKGNILWQFHLDTIGRFYHIFDEKWVDGTIWHIVGLVDGILWVDVISSTLIGIDAETGLLKYTLTDGIAMTYFPQGEKVQKPMYSKTTYDKKEHKLWGIEAYSYWEVDLKEAQPRLKVWYIQEEIEKHQTTLPNFDTCGITENHIFFSMGGLGGNRVPQVAALNRNTLKVDWQYQFIEEGIYYSPTEVQVTDNNLFVLDNQGTLHIFERTEE